jgi:hypothetical protein
VHTQSRDDVGGETTSTGAATTEGKEDDDDDDDDDDAVFDPKTDTATMSESVRRSRMMRRFYRLSARVINRPYRTSKKNLEPMFAFVKEWLVRFNQQAAVAESRWVLIHTSVHSCDRRVVLQPESRMVRLFCSSVSLSLSLQDHTTIYVVLQPVSHSLIFPPPLLSRSLYCIIKLPPPLLSRSLCFIIKLFVEVLHLFSLALSTVL